MSLDDDDATERFERTILPHRESAYNLARWLARDPSEAEDVVQEAIVRALRFFSGFRGENGRAWLLAIVRNTWITKVRQRGGSEASEAFDEEIHSPESSSENPERRLEDLSDAVSVRAALEALTPAYREILVLREIEEMSYKEIGSVIGAPIGTVMSRLARARRSLRDRVLAEKRPYS